MQYVPGIIWGAWAGAMDFINVRMPQFTYQTYIAGSY